MGDITMAALVAVAAAGVVATAGVVAAAGHRCGALFYRVTSTGDQIKLERAWCGLRSSERLRGGIERCAVEGAAGAYRHTTLCHDHTYQSCEIVSSCEYAT